MDETYRGTGRTTRQMENAPKGAVFVWCNGNLDYPKLLAKKTGREDLEIVSPMWLSDRRWEGLELKGLVIDHATRLSGRQLDALDIARTRVRP